MSEIPGWWCQETPWPPIGPDVAGYANDIPAKRRFEGLPCRQAKALILTGSPADETIALTWEVNAALPLTATWTIDYEGTPGNQPPPITGIHVETRAYALTGLTNYAWYTITLATDPPLLADTVTAMPTDHIVYLPVARK